MGAAVAVHERADRPSALEVVTILAICAALLVVLGIVDDRAARREAARANAVLATRAEHAGERASREAMTAPIAPAARTERLGRDTLPIVIPAGPAWGPGTSVVSHTQTADPTPVPARPVAINRIIGPTVVHPTALGEPATGPATPESTLAPLAAPVAKSSAPPAANPRAPADAPGTPSPGPVLVLLMAGAGLSMAGAGLQVLSRRSA